MVNISDFFKKEDEDKTKKAPVPQSEEIKPKESVQKEPPSEKPAEIIPKEEIKKSSSFYQKPVVESQVKTSDIIKEESEVFSYERTKALYDDCLGTVRRVFEKAKNNEELSGIDIKAKIDIIVQQILCGNYNLIGLINSHTQINYLYAHSVNVCILSILLGQGMAYSKAKLQELGIAALLHDIGMSEVMDITQKEKKLTKEEYDKVKKHPLFKFDISGLSDDLVQLVVSVARQHHESANGKGYPQGLKAKQIDEYAKIVATADSYEALTHPREYRKRLSPYEALKEMLNNRQKFDYQLLKVLIQQISVYPVGSYVQLSSDEVGMVVKTNKESPLRSVVKILFDSDKVKLKEEKVVDLGKSPTLYIKKSINEKELDLQ